MPLDFRILLCSVMFTVSLNISHLVYWRSGEYWIDQIIIRFNKPIMQMCVQMNFAQRSLQPFASLLLQFAVFLWPYIYIILPFLSVSVPFFLLSNIFCKKSFPIALFLKRIFCFSLHVCLALDSTAVLIQNMLCLKCLAKVLRFLWGFSSSHYILIHRNSIQRISSS